MTKHDVAREIVLYDVKNRGCGKTRAVMKAMKETPATIMIVHNHEFASLLSKKYDLPLNRFVTLSNISHEGLNIMKRPFLIDNFALATLLADMCVEDTRKRKLIEDIKEKLTEYEEENVD